MSEDELNLGIRKRFYNIKKRCRYPGHLSYEKYSKVYIYEPWLQSVGLFIEYMKSLPGCDLSKTIDRIDNAKGYEPGNLRWISRAEQNRNMTSNVWLEFRGEQILLADLAKYARVGKTHIRRLYERGYTPEEIVQYVPRSRKTK